MTKIKIKETGEIEEILCVDPRSGIDWSMDLLGYCNDFDGYDDDLDCYIMSEENYDWWNNYANEYQKADFAITELFKEKPELIEEYELLNLSEFNEQPTIMMAFVEENK